jgi:hypothetical protein
MPIYKTRTVLKLTNVRHFEVSTAVVTKSIIFWDVMPCSLLSCNRRFGGTYHLHLQGRRNNFSKNQQASLPPPPKCLLQLHRLHGVTSQKMILFWFTDDDSLLRSLYNVDVGNVSIISEVHTAPIFRVED